MIKMLIKFCKTRFFKKRIVNDAYNARHLIADIIRARLGIGPYQLFQFENQKDPRDYYFISESAVFKIRLGFSEEDNGVYSVKKSRVSFNYLLSDECVVINHHFSYFNLKYSQARCKFDEAFQMMEKGEL